MYIYCVIGRGYKYADFIVFFADIFETILQWLLNFYMVCVAYISSFYQHVNRQPPIVLTTPSIIFFYTPTRETRLITECRYDRVRSADVRWPSCLQHGTKIFSGKLGGSNVHRTLDGLLRIVQDKFFMRCQLILQNKLYFEFKWMI